MKLRNKKGEFTKRSRLTRIEEKRHQEHLRTVRNNSLLAAFILGFLFACIFAPVVYDYFHPKKESKIIEKVKVEAVEVKDKYKERGYAYCFDPIICIRDVGEEMGMTNKDITTMIKIAKAESSLRPEAKNPHSTATGIFQIIIGTWDSNRCEGERWDFVDNIKCGWKIYQLRGTQPWNASKSVWNK